MTGACTGNVFVCCLAATVTNGAIVIHTQRLKSDPGGNLLS
ncbi:nonribosomal peptide synthetase/polyketide synthase [Yersinia pestis subsp. microtus bv. Caucasica]|nr:nonribosomal peptide synthetase/polyketide synthase [Yersinia pestis subsp. microtus bv. Caucasica]OSZ83527.1 nonribosomal peptide synthetase/polyketide synthase [Yersinia pestis subsp. microtus bv. Caucasica]OSZ83586.1 nonribosomal peptide synthetase/polyketide synthase [Yersinia pestis subsp. microtus bv. Caucasica]OSZ95779.1 nonribosomal peptide synthetase/polyketide synthase [Yersinia pestis subsp. microtus bv. Caucasica]